MGGGGNGLYTQHKITTSPNLLVVIACNYLFFPIFYIFFYIPKIIAK